jgi:hypothetical protein
VGVEHTRASGSSPTNSVGDGEFRRPTAEGRAHLRVEIQRHWLAAAIERLSSTRLLRQTGTYLFEPLSTSAVSSHSQASEHHFRKTL